MFPPGGSVDQVARILAQQLTKQLGQSVVVENIGGASGSIGTAAVAKAAPDGYTFGVVFDTHGTNPSLIPNIQFDTLKDLAHVTLIGTSPMALVASSKSKYSSAKDMLADARTVKGINIGSIGTGSLGHLAMIQAGKQGRLVVDPRAVPRRRPVDERHGRRPHAARHRHGVPRRCRT